MKGQIEIGEMERVMGIDLMERLEDVRNQCQKYDFPYIMVVCASILGTVVTTKVLTMTVPQFHDHFPVPMLGTIALRIDNRKGECKCLWVLPRDVPLDEAELYDNIIETVAEQAFALKMPIYNA